MIRCEMKQDHETVRELDKLAFGGKVEARLVEKIRSSAGFIPALSLVAVEDGVVVGHILFSPVTIETGGGSVDALALAPVAVCPEYQKRGIGSDLVRAGMTACREQGHEIVIVVGHPGFYPRFGFVRAGERGLKAPFDVPEEAFMAAGLVPGALEGVAGTVRYPPAFDEAE